MSVISIVTRPLHITNQSALACPLQEAPTVIMAPPVISTRQPYPWDVEGFDIDKITQVRSLGPFWDTNGVPYMWMEGCAEPVPIQSEDGYTWRVADQVSWGINAYTDQLAARPHIELLDFAPLGIPRVPPSQATVKRKRSTDDTRGHGDDVPAGAKRRQAGDGPESEAPVDVEKLVRETRQLQANMARLVGQLRRETRSLDRHLS